jgi:hypothetical protein
MAALWEPIIAGTLVFATVVLAGVVAVGVLVWRYGRRKWRAFHSHGLVVGAVALWEATASGRVRWPTSSGDVATWTPRRVRRELWKAVDGADAAVRAATRAGAPIASLPGICRRLRDVAVDLDRVLRVEPAGTVPADVASQAVEVMQAAGDVQRAAVASAGDANGQRVRDLVHDADQEVRCLDAGLASVQAVLPHRPD